MEVSLRKPHHFESRVFALSLIETLQTFDREILMRVWRWKPYLLASWYSRFRFRFGCSLGETLAPKTPKDCKGSPRSRRLYTQVKPHLMVRFAHVNDKPMQRFLDSGVIHRQIDNMQAHFPFAFISLSRFFFIDFVPLARCGLRGCLFAPTGKRFTALQEWHVITRTSAQSFLPPRLLFSTRVDEVLPGTKIASQRLQMECFRAWESRIWPFSETDRSWDTKWRLGPNVSVESWLTELCGTLGTVFGVSVFVSCACLEWFVDSDCTGPGTLFSVVAVVVPNPWSEQAFMRSVAAWWRYDIRQYKCRCETPMAFFSAFIFCFIWSKIWWRGNRRKDYPVVEYGDALGLD